MTFPLPDATHVKVLLSMLFDGLTIKPAKKFLVSGSKGAYCAVYVGVDGSPVGVCACDIAFAANSGAALSMLPPAVAKEAVKGFALTEVMVANLREVMNICTRLLLRDDTAHLRLEQVYPVSQLPAAIAQKLAACARQADYEVSMGKYAPGMISVMDIS
jgi:hypothetical protein